MASSGGTQHAPFDLAGCATDTRHGPPRSGSASAEHTSNACANSGAEDPPQSLGHGRLSPTDPGSGKVAHAAAVRRLNVLTRAWGSVEMKCEKCYTRVRDKRPQPSREGDRADKEQRQLLESSLAPDIPSCSAMSDM